MSQEDSVKPLPRGAACLVCRSRKVKCDGQRPVCSQCTRGSLQDQCEYADSGPSKVRVLEDTISDLQRKIQELEQLQQAPHNIFTQSNAGISESSCSARAFTHIANSSPSGSPPFGSPSPSGSTQEPPQFIIRSLLHSFTHASFDLHFFLDMSRFKDSALLPLPLGHHSRPLPALLSVVYLWGVHLSQTDGAQTEANLLQEAVQLLKQAPTSDHPSKVLHSIQAELLLALYYHCNGGIIDGKNHLRSATRLAFQFGLHKYRSNQQFDILPPPRDLIEDGERIAAFWTVFIANNCWTGGFGYPSNISYSSSDMRIDVPWLPDNIMDIQNLWSDGSTVANFLQGSATGQTSRLALHAKASLLYERATHLFAQSRNSRSYSNEEALETLNGLIISIRSSTPPPDHSDYVRVITHALLCAAMIQLHHRFVDQDVNSRNLCLTAAKEMLNQAHALGSDPRTHHLSPVLCILWRQACMAVIQEAKIMRSSAASSQSSTSLQCLKDMINQGTATMKRFNTTPLMTYEYTLIEESLAGV